MIGFTPAMLLRFPRPWNHSMTLLLVSWIVLSIQVARWGAQALELRPKEAITGGVIFVLLVGVQGGVFLLWGLVRFAGWFARWYLRRR
jgi:hypothetical protein